MVRLRGFHVENRRAVLGALDVHAATGLDFGDAMIVAAMRMAGTGLVYSYDRDFDALSDIERREPQRSRRFASARSVR